MAIQIQYRRGTANEWTAANPTLAPGEPGYETDTGKFKVGYNATAWATLPYSSGFGYDGVTSTSTVTPVATGTITVTTNKQNAFVTGQRIRVINTSTNYFEGIVTISGGTTFAVIADYVSSSPAQASSWTVVAAGATGPVGLTGLGYDGVTSTSSVTPAATGTITLTTNKQNAFVTGQRIRAYNTSTNYFEGIVTITGNTNFAIAADYVSSSPAQASSWTVAAAGVIGSIGSTGPGYDGVTSTSTVTPAATGTITLTTNKQNAFVTGQRIRAINTSTNYFEGIVTITGNTSFAIAADYVSSSPVQASSWTIAAAGTIGPSGEVTLVGAQTLTNKTLTAPVINAPTITGYTEASITANSGATYTVLDPASNGTILYITLTANCTFTFPTPAVGKSFMLVLIQDATGARTTTFPATIRWPSGTTPTLTTTASKQDKFIFTATSAVWLGSVAGLNYAIS